MNKKVLSILMAIVLIISAVALPNVFAKEDTAEAQTHFEKTENGVTLSVDLDKPEYATNGVIAEPVEATYTFTNNLNNVIYCLIYTSTGGQLGVKHHEEGSFFVGGERYSGSFAAIMPTVTALEPGKAITKKYILTGKYHNNLDNDKDDGIAKVVEAGEYDGNVWMMYSDEVPESNSLINTKKISLDFKVKYVDKPSTSGNAEPADVQLDVTEVGTVGDGIVTGDDTKLYAVIRNNGTEKGTAKVTVNFSVAGSRVETETYEVNVDPGKSTVVTSTKDWTADFGSWSVRADIRQEGANADARAIRQSYIKSRVAVAD